MLFETEIFGVGQAPNGQRRQPMHETEWLLEELLKAQAHIYRLRAELRDERRRHDLVESELRFVRLDTQAI